MSVLPKGWMDDRQEKRSCDGCGDDFIPSNWSPFGRDFCARCGGVKVEGFYAERQRQADEHMADQRKKKYEAAKSLVERERKFYEPENDPGALN